MKLWKKRITVAIVSIAMAFTMFPLLGTDISHAVDSEMPNVGDNINIDIVETEGTSTLCFYVDDDYNGECFLDPTDDGSDWRDFRSDLIAGKNYEVSQIFIGNRIYGIGEGFFEGMTNITTVAIPETIGDYVKTGKGIHKNAFKDCNNIAALYYGGTKAEWNYVNMNLQEGNKAINMEPESYCYDENLMYTDISNAKYNMFGAYQYTGTWIRPKLEITVDGSPISKGRSFATNYTNNKNVGKANLFIRGKNHYKGRKTLHFKINPLGTSVRKVTSPAKKKIKVTWERQGRYMTQTRITGYQVKISRSSKFTKSTTSTAKVKGYSKLSKTFNVKKSGKKYYAKVRTYKVVDGVTYWSKWSKLKSGVAK